MCLILSLTQFNRWSRKIIQLHAITIFFSICLQCWNWPIWILPAWRWTPNSHCSINRPCCACLY